jgi:triacylglycerol lipase
MIVDLDMADKVATLATIGTPHLGTTFADFGITRGGRLVIEGRHPIINLEGFADLTTASCKAFNNRARDQEAGNDVVYQTYAAAEERDLVFLPLQASWSIIHQREGENDSLVSVQSQQWEAELVGSHGRRKKVIQKTCRSSRPPQRGGMVGPAGNQSTRRCLNCGQAGRGV